MQVINFDTEHFKNTVIGNVGESTFQEGEIREIIILQIMKRIKEKSSGGGGGGSGIGDKIGGEKRIQEKEKYWSSGLETN